MEIEQKMKYIYRKIKGRLKKSAEIPPEKERTAAVLPPEGETISVEMILNSRCSSDYDDDQTIFHWGMFDKTKKLSYEHAKKIINLVKICRFTEHRAEIIENGHILTFIVENGITGIQKDWVMIESGMQQQATALICTALGIGTVLKNQGKDGTEMSSTNFSTIKLKLDPMKPSYDASYWTHSAPATESPWLSGNLPDPERNGSTPLITAIKNINIQNRDSQNVKMHSIGQLLWAARGRTPHLYKSKPWGMTIPTWGGEQHISSVYLILDSKLYKYINWIKNRPTNSIKELKGLDIEIHNNLNKSIPQWNCFIILSANEMYARALWEIGYQVFNILLQAQTLNIAYHAILLDSNQRELFSEMNIENPVAIIGLRK
jgi:hypothetical protein